MSIIVENEDFLEKNKSKKIVKIIIILLIILFFISIAAYGGIYYLKLKEFKVFINGSRNSNIESVFYTENGKLYVAIKDIANYLGYDAYNGEYQKYSEDKTKCYLKGANEIVTYSLDSDIIYKIITVEKIEEDTTNVSNILANPSLNYEYYTLDEPVRLINDKLYCSIESIELGTNSSITYTENNNTVTIYTLDSITKNYMSVVKEMTSDAVAIFSNRKAILYNFAIVKGAENKYGVLKYNNGTLEEVIGKKYSYIKFIESSQEFLVLTDEGKIGIIDKDGNTIIEPIYDEMKQIDKDGELYLVAINKKYGVINRDGEIIIFLEYDEIGINKEKFPNDNIENSYILYNKCIPVKKGEKWGFIDIKGNAIGEIEFDDIGTNIIGTTNMDANNFMLIPEYEAIVVMQNLEYMILDTSGKVLIPSKGNITINGESVIVPLTQMYSEIISGEQKYYMVYERTNSDTHETYEYDIKEFLKDILKIKPVYTEE